MRYIVLASGKIRTRNFWPRGTSDADTIKLDISSGGIFYGGLDSEFLDQTHVFEGAYTFDDENEKKPLINKKEIVEVRLEGIDAPELHLPIEYEGFETKHFRQFFGKTSTIKLGDVLGDDLLLDCEVWSFADEPRDLFDAYGRLIGTAIVFLDDERKTELNVNQWLVNSGWAMPTFYTSMPKEQIELLLELGMTAQAKNRGLWRYYYEEVDREDLTLTFDYRDRRYNAAADRGPVLLPKIFRRAADWARGIELGLIDPQQTFKEFLASRLPDIFYFTTDYLEYGINAMIPQYYLEDVITDDGVVELTPFEAVFKEKPSLIYDRNDELIRSFEPKSWLSLPSVAQGVYTAPRRAIRETR